MSVPVVAAPATAEDARQTAINNLANLLTNLQPGLAQGQTDQTTLQNLLNAWPADVDTALQPIAQICIRLIQYTSMAAQGIQDTLTALQTFP